MYSIEPVTLKFYTVMLDADALAIVRFVKFKSEVVTVLNVPVLAVSDVNDAFSFEIEVEVNPDNSTCVWSEAAYWLWVWSEAAYWECVCPVDANPDKAS